MARIGISVASGACVLVGAAYFISRGLVSKRSVGSVALEADLAGVQCSGIRVSVRLQC